MTNQPLTASQVAVLVGGIPMDFALYPDSQELVVIGPTGQKSRFQKEEWQSVIETPQKHKPAPSLPKSQKPQPVSKQPAETQPAAQKAPQKTTQSGSAPKGHPKRGRPPSQSAK
jgi:hypothetical protein